MANSLGTQKERYTMLYIQIGFDSANPDYIHDWNCAILDGIRAALELCPVQSLVTSDEQPHDTRAIDAAESAQAICADALAQRDTARASEQSVRDALRAVLPREGESWSARDAQAIRHARELLGIYE